MADEAGGDTLLQIENLRTYFHTHAGIVRAVQGVNLHLDKGETLGIVGESGSGKSVTALSIMRLIPQPPGEFAGGRILFRGTPIVDVREEKRGNEIRRVDKSISESQMRRIRGGDIGMIFQDPMTSLNPLLTIGRQIAETVQEHMGVGRKEAYDRATEMLMKVGIPSAKQRLKDFPFQFSGGMRQRVMIAIALSTNPDLLIADEPTTALDVTIQAQILDLMRGLSAEFGSSVILITHDLGVVAGMAQRVAVMYAGYVVETAVLDDIFYHAQHPYTHMLLQSIPRLDLPRDQPLHPIPGSPPDLLTLGPGCPFVPRCPNALPICRQQMPPLDPVGGSGGHLAACWNPVKEKAA
ncbi:MAG TPA: ABC transporter ATP-binding protein [Chloroflexota bacterium]|nr:ABC transporter ATP-binding protein [Chloroflexota bacterium]